MIRRRSTISIYDYPEHLNPFREERRESIGNKFRSFGQRGSSFRNAWNLLLPRSKRSQSFSRNSSSADYGGSPRTSYDSWTVGRPSSRSRPEAIGLPASWTIAPRRRYTPPSSEAGSPPRSPSARGSQLSVATLCVDVPSPDDRSSWQGARPKKRRAPLPPTSPTASSATSSHTSSTASLRDAQQPDDAKDTERESLQLLVSRIQQEFGEQPEVSKYHSRDERKGKETGDSDEDTKGHVLVRVEKTSVNVDKAFVVEPCANPASKSGDTAEENSPIKIKNETVEKAAFCVATDTDRNTENDEDKTSSEPSAKAAEDDTLIEEPQVIANVFVATTSRTISSDGRKLASTATDDAKTSKTAEPESLQENQEKVSSVTKLPEANLDLLDQSIKNGQIDGKSEGNSLIAEALNECQQKTSTNEYQVETLSGRYESGAFVVSTPDTASVYEDAASEEDTEDHEVKTILNNKHTPNLQEAHTLDCSKKTINSNVSGFSNGVPLKAEDNALHTKTSFAIVTPDYITCSETNSSDVVNPKTHATAIPRDASPESTLSSNTTDRKIEYAGISGNLASVERTPSNSLKHQTSFSGTCRNDSSFRVMPNKRCNGTTSGNESPIIPKRDIKAGTNGDILHPPVTTPRNKPTNGLPDQTFSTVKMESPVSSSATTPTPPPRNKPQPVPRMKRLKKLFSHQ